jgi:hypothetical protein
LSPDRRRNPQDDAAEPQRALLATLRQSVATAAPERSLQSAARALAVLARSTAPAAHALLAPNPQAQEQREQALDELAQIIVRTQGYLPGGARTPDVPARIVLGGLLRLLSARRRRGEPLGRDLTRDLADWIARYERPRTEQHWHRLQTLALPPPAPFPPPLALPLSVPPGSAGAHETYFQQVMSVTASAYFRASDWPARIWRAGRAAARLIGEDDELAHASFVHAPADGEHAAARIENNVLAFTLFLQEGYQYAPASTSPPPRVALEAIAASVFEIGYLNARRQEGTPLSGLVAHVTYLALTPFLGPVAADREIEAFVCAARAGREGSAG